MSKPATRRVVLVSGLVLATAVGLYGASILLGPGAPMGAEDWPAEFRSNGERIYFTGASASGLPILSRGGTMHMDMHGGGCATCHRADRQGGRLMPRFWKTVPPLTPAALFDRHDEVADHDRAEEEQGHGDHEAYDDASLARAIQEGIDPSGEQLDRGMPRWSMEEQDLADLIAFLKTPARQAGAAEE